MQIVAYTDGACKGNPGKGGWGWICWRSFDGVIQKWSDCGGAITTTNNIMELTAMIEFVVSVPQNSTVLVYTDSKYVLHSLVAKSGDTLTTPGVYSGWMKGWINSGWERPLKNTSLFKRLHSILRTATKTSKFTIMWVKGHSNDPGNEEADSLANKGIPK